MKRKRYSDKLKSKVALAAIKGDRTANEIASEFGIHVSQVHRWKKEAIDLLPELFGMKGAKRTKDIEKEKHPSQRLDLKAITFHRINLHVSPISALSSLRRYRYTTGRRDHRNHDGLPQTNG